MVSKRLFSASALVALMGLAACFSMPWRDAPPPAEVNLSFTLRNNLLFISSARINGRSGRYFFGSADSRSVLDPHTLQELGGPRTFSVQLGQRETVVVTPVSLDLGGTGDAILGADVFGSHAITIDYRAGLITDQTNWMNTALMKLYPYTAEPSADIEIDGRILNAVIDTASPDTLILPATAETRGKAHIALAGADLGIVDVRYSAVARPRIGNRLLSRFLVSIDYRHRVVGLWRDPRIR